MAKGGSRRTSSLPRPRAAEPILPSPDESERRPLMFRLRGTSSAVSPPARTGPDGQLPYCLGEFGKHADTGERLGIYPAKGSGGSCAAVAERCSYNEAFGQYASTRAWIKRISEEIGMAGKRRESCGEPHMKTGPPRRGRHVPGQVRRMGRHTPGRSPKECGRQVSQRFEARTRNAPRDGCPIDGLPIPLTSSARVASGCRAHRATRPDDRGESCERCECIALSEAMAISLGDCASTAADACGNGGGRVGCLCELRAAGLRRAAAAEDRVREAFGSGPSSAAG